jgi:hypothetical protein
MVQTLDVKETKFMDRLHFIVTLIGKIFTSTLDLNVFATVFKKN